MIGYSEICAFIGVNNAMRNISQLVIYHILVYYPIFDSVEYHTVLVMKVVTFNKRSPNLEGKYPGNEAGGLPSIPFPVG
jgi:hypothetical protein